MQRLPNPLPSKYLYRYLTRVRFLRNEEDLYYYAVICLPFTHINYRRKASKKYSVERIIALEEQSEKFIVGFWIRDLLIEIQKKNWFVKFPNLWNSIIEKCSEVIIHFKNEWIERAIKHSMLLDIPERKQAFVEGPDYVPDEDFRSFIYNNDYEQIVELAILDDDYEFLQTIGGHVRKHREVTIMRSCYLNERRSNPYQERFCRAYFTLINQIEPADVNYSYWSFVHASEELKKMHSEIDAKYWQNL